MELPDQYVAGSSKGDLTQDQRLDMRAFEAIHLVNIGLPTSGTLRVAERDYVYRYGSSELIYESYIAGFSGLEEAADGSMLNSRLQIRMINAPWGDDGDPLSLADGGLWARASVTIYEVRLFSPKESFSSDVRSVVWKGFIQEIFDITPHSFTIQCCSRLYNWRNSLGLRKITRELYPGADPNDIGTYRNICIGQLEHVPARCVNPGAVDILAKNIDKTETIVLASGIAQLAWDAAPALIQIDNEVLRYTSYDSDKSKFICTRAYNGTTATAHNKAAPIFQVRTEYLYEAAMHPSKAVHRVFVDNIRQTSYFVTYAPDNPWYSPEGEMDVYSGQPEQELSGHASKTMIKFRVKPTAKKQINLEFDDHTHQTDMNENAHTHTDSDSRSLKKDPIDATGTNCDHPGNAINGDSDYAKMEALPNSASYLYIDFDNGVEKNGTMTAVFTILAEADYAETGETLELWYDGDFITEWDMVDLPKARRRCTCTCTTACGTFEFKLLGGTEGIAYVYDITAEFTYNVSISSSKTDLTANAHIDEAAVLSGLTTAELVIGKQVTVDLDGVFDADGSITGTSNTLIERPDHVFKYFLVTKIGASSSLIGSSFATAGSWYQDQDFRFAFILHDVATDAQELFRSLAEQCRSTFHDWAGLFELKVLPSPTSSPDPDFTVDPYDLADQPVWRWTGASEIKNRVSLFYRRDYRSDPSAAQSLRISHPDAVARGYMDCLVETDGDADLEEELLFNAVRESDMAQDLVDFYLALRKSSRLCVTLQVNWRSMRLAPGMAFDIEGDLWGDRHYRVTRFRPDRDRGVIQIEGRV